MRDTTDKYLDFPRKFHHLASEIDIRAKQQIRACEKIGTALAREKPKTAADFELLEARKDFVIKSMQLSEEMVNLLSEMKLYAEAVANDAVTLADGARMADTIKFQSDTIVLLTKQRDDAVSRFYELKRIKGITE